MSWSGTILIQIKAVLVTHPSGLITQQANKKLSELISPRVWWQRIAHVHEAFRAGFSDAPYTVFAQREKLWKLKRDNTTLSGLYGISIMTKPRWDRWLIGLSSCCGDKVERAAMHPTPRVMMPGHDAACCSSDNIQSFQKPSQEVIPYKGNNDGSFYMAMARLAHLTG